MPIKMVCECGAKFAAREELAGKDVECTACGKTLKVPRHAPPSPGVSSGGRRALVTGMSILGVAVAACGFMIYTLQGQVTDLQGELSTAQSRVGVVEKELESNKKADEATAADVVEDKKLLADVQNKLADETKNREALLGNLDKLEMDAVRIRNDIQRVDQERTAAWEQMSRANREKRDAYDRQLTTLQGELGTKASAQDTARIRAQIKKVEADKDALARQSKANKTRLVTYDTRLTGLQNQLREKIVEQDRLGVQLARAQTNLTSLNRQVKPATLQKQIIDMRKRMGTTRSEPFKTVAFDDKVRNQSMWFRVDTRTGRADYRVGRYRNVIAGGPGGGRGGRAAKQKPGQYDLQLTFASSGRVYDVVLLHAETGRLWSCEIRGGARSLAWRPVYVLQPPRRGRPGTSKKWRLSVSRNGGKSTTRAPMLVLTDPDGRIYDDSLGPRVFMLPSY